MCCQGGDFRRCTRELFEAVHRAPVLLRQASVGASMLACSRDGPGGAELDLRSHAYALAGVSTLGARPKLDGHTQHACCTSTSAAAVHGAGRGLPLPLQCTVTYDQLVLQIMQQFQPSDMYDDEEEEEYLEPQAHTHSFSVPGERKPSCFHAVMLMRSEWAC